MDSCMTPLFSVVCVSRLDHRGTQIYLGINHTGISTFASGKRVQHFRWPEVHKLNYEGKMFIAHLSYTDRESREPVSHFDVDETTKQKSMFEYAWRARPLRAQHILHLE